MSNTDQENRTVFITGAAKRLGAAMAEAFHAKGYQVLIHYHQSKTEAEALAEKLNRQREGSARLYQADLSNHEEVLRLARNINNSCEQLDVLINNASRFYPTPLATAQEDDWLDLIDTNVKAPFFLSQQLAPLLTRSEGCIINLVDINSERPLANHAIYNISKAAMSMLTQTLAQSLGPKVRVNGISPGAILWPEFAAEGLAEQQAMIDKTVLKTQGDPADIANAALFLAEQSSYTSGHIIPVDGGRSLNQ